MQNDKKIYNFLSILIAASIFTLNTYAQVPAIKPTQDSITTVDQLLLVENSNTRFKARQDAISNGSLQPETLPTRIVQPDKKPQPANIFIKSIVGVSDSTQADIIFNGDTYNSVTVGSNIGKCTIQDIKGQCITFNDYPIAYHIKKKKSDLPLVKKSNMCPTSCWTGLPPFTQANNDTGTGSPLPPGMPYISGQKNQLPNSPVLVKGAAANF